MREANLWFRLATGAWMLGVDSAAVMALRAAVISAGGPAADTETRRMISEKIAAASELQMMAMAGVLGRSGPAAATKTIAHYRRKVSANRRRLSKK